MTDRELMQMALDCLLAWEEESSGYGWSISDKECVEALRARLAQPESEPVAVMKVDEDGDVKSIYWEMDLQTGEHDLYTAPPQREWKGLTDEEIDELAEANLDFNWKDGVEDFARAIEAKLKEKNG